MILINSIGDLDQLLKKYNLKGTRTNSYLLLDSFNEYITSNLLYYDIHSGNLFIYLNRNSYFRLYYYINHLKQCTLVSSVLPIVTEILFRGDSNRPTDEIRLMSDCGLKEHIIRDHYAGNLSQLNTQRRYNDDILVRYASSKIETEFTKDIIEKTFDPYTGDILNSDEVEKYVLNENVLCAYYKGTLAGILQFEIKNNVVWLGHIAILSEFQAKGIGYELIFNYINLNAKSETTKYQLWVMRNNLKAVELYKSIGFIYTNKSSLSMLKSK